MKKSDSNKSMPPKIIPPHGGYRDLKSYQVAEIMHDATAVFCDRFVDRRSRTHDQMVQAARWAGGRATASGTSKKTELKLVGVARAAGPAAELPTQTFGGGRWDQPPGGAVPEELLLDFRDYLRQHGLPLWGKDHPHACQVRGLCYKSSRSYLTPDHVRGRLYKPFTEAPASAETAANTMICLIHQANYLLDQQLRALEQEFLKEGGFREKLSRTLIRGACRPRRERRSWVAAPPPPSANAQQRKETMNYAGGEPLSPFVEAP